MPETWRTRRLEFCLDRWIAEDQPDDATVEAVYLWLMSLLDDPRPDSAARVAISAEDMWLAEVPATTVNILYIVFEEEREIVFWTIETL